MRASWLGRIVGILIMASVLWLGVLMVTGGSLEQVITAISAFVLLIAVYVAVVGFDRRGGP